MTNSGPLIERLIASAQSGLAAVEQSTDYRAKRAHIKAADVQARCAHALATKELADAVLALVVTEGEPS